MLLPRSAATQTWNLVQLVMEARCRFGLSLIHSPAPANTKGREKAFQRSSVNTDSDLSHTTRNHAAPHQAAGEDVSHTAREATIKAEATADEGKHRTKGLAARLWGRGEVRGLAVRCFCLMSAAYRLGWVARPC